MSLNPWKFELVLLISLLAVGLLVIPVLIYFTAAPVAGDYPGEGLWGLIKHIWGDLGRGRPFAWLMVLCPYLFLQLLRLSVVSWRSSQGVNQVTDSEQT
jgi:hypothetical protein